MMKQISQNYFIDEKQPLGRGGFGTVYKGYYQQTQEPPFWVAVKELRRFSDGKNENLYYDQEIATTQQIMKIQSEYISNIVRVYEIFPSSYEADVQYVVMDLCAKDLSAFKKEKGGKLESQQVLRIIREIALGIKALHDCQIAHRDIKPDNIFLSLVQLPNGAEGYLYKVGNFGLGKDDNLLESKVGTICYMAPDMLDFSKMEYTNKVDIWALGVMTHEILTGTIIYNGSSSDHVRSNILKSPPYKTWYKESFNKVQKDYIDRSFQFIDHECIVDLIDQMLEKDPQKRKNVDEILALIDTTITKYEDFKANLSMNRLLTQTDQQTINSQNLPQYQNYGYLNPQYGTINNRNPNISNNQELITLKQKIKDYKEQLDNQQLIIQDKCDEINKQYEANKKNEKIIQTLNKQHGTMNNNNPNQSNNQELITLKQTIKDYKEQLDNQQLIIQDKCDEINKQYQANKKNEKIVQTQNKQLSEMNNSIQELSEKLNTSEYLKKKFEEELKEQLSYFQNQKNTFDLALKEKQNKIVELKNNCLQWQINNEKILNHVNVELCNYIPKEYISEFKDMKEQIEKSNNECLNKLNNI